MAKLEKTIRGDFNSLLRRIEEGILSGSISASLEESSDFCIGDTRCSVLKDTVIRDRIVSVLVLLCSAAEIPYIFQQ